MAFGSGNWLFPYAGLNTWIETTSAGASVGTHSIADPGPLRVAFLPDGRFITADKNGDSSTDEFHVYNSTPTLLNTQAVTPFTSGGAVCSNFSDTFYAVASANTVKTISADGSTVTNTTGAMPRGTSSVIVGLGISADGNTLYYGDRTNYSGGGAGGAIRSWDLPGNAAIGVVVAVGAGDTLHHLLQLPDLTLLAHMLDGAVEVVRHYALDGSLLGTWTDPDGNGIVCIAVDPVDTSYFVATSIFWNGSADVNRFWRISTASMSVASTFDVTFVNAPFYFVITPTTGPTPPTMPTVTTEFPGHSDCCDKAGPNGGSTPGDIIPATSPDWTSVCDHGGVYLSASDPTDSFSTDVAVLNRLDTWIELYIAKYPANLGTTTLRYAKQPLADSGSFKEGRVISFGKSRRACTDPDGNYEQGRISVLLDDSDGTIRAYLDEGSAEEYFANREAVIYSLTEAGRVAGTTPRVRFRGWISSVQLLPRRQVRIEISDVIGSQFSGFNLDKEIGVPITTAEHPNAPEATLKRIYPIYIGEFSDLDAFAVTPEGNVPAEKGMVPAIDCGDYDITALDSEDAPDPEILAPPVITDVDVTGTTGEEWRYYGATLVSPLGESAMSNIMGANGAVVRNLSHYNSIVGTYDLGDPSNPNRVRIWYGPTEDNMVGYLDMASDDGAGTFGYADGAHPYPSPTRADQDIVKYADAPAGGVTTNGNVWAWMVCGIGYGYEIMDVFGSDLADQVAPSRTKLDASVHGVEIITPDDAEWPLANPYWDKGGVRQWGFFARGKRLMAHREGTVTFAVTACGPHDADDKLIGTTGEALKLFLNEHVVKNDGTGYRTGDYGPLETYANGDSVINTTSFEEAQAVTEEFIPGGYRTPIHVTEPTTRREIMRRIVLSTGWRFQADRHGRIGAFVISDLDSPTTGRHLRDRIEIKRVEDDVLAWDEVLNRVKYSYHFDPDGGDFRAKDLTAEHAVSIAAHVPGGVVGTATKKAVKEQTREMPYVNDEATAADVVSREMLRRKRRPRYVKPVVDLMGLDYDIGDAFIYTHYNGLGSAGDAETPMIALAIEDDIDRDEVTFELQDLRGIRTGQNLVLGDDSAGGGMPLGDETDGDPIPFEMH